MRSTLQHPLQPIIFSAKEAHQKGWVVYDDQGVVSCSHPLVKEALAVDVATITPEHQYPLVFSSMSDLAKALSSLSNSPAMNDGRSLREKFDEDFQEYLTLMQSSQENGQWEPDYGTYVFDHVMGDLYSILPEEWHKVGLVTSTGKLLSDPEDKKNWFDVRNTLGGLSLGFIGASVGGNVIEGVMREVRCSHVKVADPDWIELNNLNRLERGSIRHLGQSRASRDDIRNPYEVRRYNKADIAAYYQNMVDPYANWFVYPEGLNSENFEKFLLGNGKDEPRLDMLIEEADDLSLKIEIRKLCRKHGIPVLMMTDFGHCAILHFQDFKNDPEMNLAFAASDEEILGQLDKALSSGNREEIFSFVEKLCGDQCIRGEFREWVHGRGEQPTSSLPQSGATAMISGGIGGKIVARYFLGHQIPSRLIYDFATGTVSE